LAAGGMNDDRFMKNIADARENGYDICCVDCGVGLFDDSDEHDTYCPRNPDVEANLERAREYAASLQSPT
jgi:hypothetical protein